MSPLSWFAVAWIVLVVGILGALALQSVKNSKRAQEKLRRELDEWHSQTIDQIAISTGMDRDLVSVEIQSMEANGEVIAHRVKEVNGLRVLGYRLPVEADLLEVNKS